MIGSRYSKDTFRIRDFLAKNRVLFTWLDLEGDPAVAQALAQFGVSEADTPIVACAHCLLLRHPSNRELAEAIGIRRPVEDMVYDLAIVGSGPAGLAAAVYGASEGLNTIVLEHTAPGGQAGSSMRIEKLSWFPNWNHRQRTGRSRRSPSREIGARISIPTPVTSLAFDQRYSVLGLERGETSSLNVCLSPRARNIAVSTWSIAAGLKALEFIMRPRLTKRRCAVGRTWCSWAAVIPPGRRPFIFRRTRARCSLLIRGDDLCKSMSSYLAHRIMNTPNIEIFRCTEVTGMSGDGHLGSIEILDKRTGNKRTIETGAVFSFIGATPRTDWLPAEVEKDEKHFVRTGITLVDSPHWTLRRQPFLLETSRPGVFAAGDVRSGSVKRVASAVGEGSMSVQFVHQYLKTM